MTERNKRLVRRAIQEVWNRGNYDAVPELAASDVVIHGTSSTGKIHGHEGIKQFFGALRAGFPDLRFTIEDQIAEGDRVVTRWSAQGTHTGEFQGIPATGRQCRTQGIDIDCIAGDKVVECWTIFDELGLLQQLGVIPGPEQAIAQEEAAAAE